MEEWSLTSESRHQSAHRLSTIGKHTALLLHLRKAQLEVSGTSMDRSGEDQMCLRLGEIGHGRRQRWDTWLRAGVEEKVCRLTAAHLPSSQKIEMGKCFLRDSEGSQRKDTDFCGISNKKAGLLTGYPRVRFTLQSPHVCTRIAILKLPRWYGPNQSKGI